MTDLNELLERVKKAHEPDRNTDALLAAHVLDQYVKREPGNRTWRVSDSRGGPWRALPNYTSSVDAALDLVDLLLPRTLRRLSDWEDGTGAKANLVLSDGSHHWADGASIPLAILAALLSALISKESQS